jgi:hypothetical protein
MIVVTLALLCVSAFGQKGQFAVPYGADLVKYPIMPGRLTTADVVKMELMSKVLKDPVMVFNHARGLQDKDGRFMLETLIPKTTVWVDQKTGTILYKEDCGNRISEVINSTVTGESIPLVVGGNIVQIKPTVPKIGWWDAFNNAMKSAAQEIWGFIKNLLAPFGWLLLFLLGLLLLGLLLSPLFWGLDKWLRHDPSPAVPPTPRTPTPSAPKTGNTPPVINQSGEFIRTNDAPPPPSTPTTDPSTDPKQEEDGVNGKRSFVTFAPAKGESPNMLRWQGMDIHHFERGADGVHTLRFTHHK